MNSSLLTLISEADIIVDIVKSFDSILKKAQNNE